MKEESAHKKLLNGVHIICAKFGEKMNGMTAAWVTRVSFDPVLIAVAIAPERYTYELIDKSGYFTINILKEGQEELAKHFGLLSGRELDKMKDIHYALTGSGVPILIDAPAWIECKVVNKVKAGDHFIFIGEVINEHIKEDFIPLPYRRESYFV